jgi:hypothetical protein
MSKVAASATGYSNPSAKKSKTNPVATLSANAGAPVVPPPLNDYRRFLNQFIVNKAPANFSQPDVDQWPDVPGGDKGQIINDIARKFNNQQRLGISEVDPNPGSSVATYGIKLNQQTNSFDPGLALRANPDPILVGHELIHANDHQIDNLNAGVWRHLDRLHADSGQDTKQYGTSVNKIKNLIDPTATFSTMYKNDLTRGPIVKEINRWKIAYNAPGGTFVPPKWDATKGTDNWSTTFPEVNTVVTDVDPASNVPNRPFLLGGPSEFPAYMSERLTEPWGANSGKNPLLKPEARFLYNTLGDMEAAYPDVHPVGHLAAGTPAYPTMNQYIKARRTSLGNAYYPGTPATPGTPPSSGNPGTLPTPAVPPGPPGGVFSHGGRVTRPKPKGYGFFDYFR